MKHSYKILSAALAAVMGLALVGCEVGGGRNVDTDIGELTEHRGELTIWWPGSATEMQAINLAVADYTAQYPDVTIKVIGQSTPDFYIAYSLACQGNSAPDIAYVDHVFVQSLAYYGYIANLSSVGYDDLKDTFVDTLWSPGIYEGKLFGLPMSANVLVTAYNKTLIARAQNTTTDSIVLPKNYAEFKQLCADICALNDASTANDPYYGLTLPAGTNHESMAAMSYLSFVDRAGGEGILSADLKGSNLNAVACVDAAKKLFELGDYAPATFSESKFENGMVGFIEMGPWKISDYEKYSKNGGWEVGYTTAIPFTEGGNYGAGLGLYDLVVTNNDNSALAADFAKFITTTDKYQLAFSTVQNLLPTTKSAVADDFYKTDVWKVYLDQLEHVAVRPGSPAWTEIEKLLGTFVTGLVQHVAPETMDTIEQECYGMNTMIQDALDEIYS